MGALNAAQMVQLEGNLLFDTDSSRLRTEARKALARIAAKLREAKVEEATIVGHTDAQGAADYNRRLSLNRAKAVRQHLVEQLELTGLEMTVRGAGETQPVASNETAEGRRLNRRVEIIF